MLMQEYAQICARRLCKDCPIRVCRVQRMYRECTRKTQGISKDCAKKCEKNPKRRAMIVQGICKDVQGLCNRELLTRSHNCCLNRFIFSGPEYHLRSVGIKPKKNLAVGENLQSHVGTGNTKKPLKALRNP